MPPRELYDKYANPVLQAALDRIEAADAKTLLAQPEARGSPDAKLQIARRWLRKHWSDGWLAAGGPSGMPEAEPAKAEKAGRG